MKNRITYFEITLFSMLILISIGFYISETRGFKGFEFQKQHKLERADKAPTPNVIPLSDDMEVIYWDCGKGVYQTL